MAETATHLARRRTARVTPEGVAQRHAILQKARGVTITRRAEGLAWAKAWRIVNKPQFDALYGPETAGV